MTKSRIRFTQQQLVLLQQMMKETDDTRDIKEVIVSMFRDHARQILGREFRA
jgi:hypothetical protein